MRDVRSIRALFLSIGAVVAGIAGAVVGAGNNTAGWYVAGLIAVVVGVAAAVWTLVGRRAAVAVGGVAAIAAVVALAVPWAASGGADDSSGVLAGFDDTVVEELQSSPDVTVARTADGWSMLLIEQDGPVVVGLDVDKGDGYLARGNVSFIHVDDGRIAAFGPDASRRWEREVPDDRNERPFAAFSDGTIVLRDCPVDPDDGTACSLIAVEPSGDERWSVEPGEIALAEAAYGDAEVGVSQYLLPAVLAGRRTPTGTEELESGGTTGVVRFDEATGEAVDEPSEGVLDGVAVAGDAVVVVSATDNDCELAVFGPDGDRRGLVQGVPCPRRGDLFVVGGLVYLSGGDGGKMIDPATGDIVDPSGVKILKTTAAGMIGGDGEDWLVGVTGAALWRFELDGSWNIASVGADALVATRPVQSANPFVAGDLHEVVVLDPATGGRCGSFRYSGGYRTAFAVAGCRALVAVPGESRAVLVGRTD